MKTRMLLAVWAMGVIVSCARAARYFLSEENGLIIEQLRLMGYKIAKRLRHMGFNALHLPPCKQNARFRTAPFYHTPAMLPGRTGDNGSELEHPDAGVRATVFRDVDHY